MNHYNILHSSVYSAMKTEELSQGPAAEEQCLEHSPTVTADSSQHLFVPSTDSESKRD